MTFAKVVSLCCCVAAFGVVVAACGVLWPPFPPLFLAFGPLKRHPPFAFPPSLCLYACVPAGTRAGGLAGRLARMSARKQAGVPTVSPAKERGFLKGCILLPLRGSIWRCRGRLWRSLPGLIATHLAFGLWPLFGIFTIPMPVCQRAGRQAQGQADWQAGELAGGQECLPVRKSENGQAGNYVFFTCVAAFGAVVAACGVFEPYFRLGKHPTFAPKRQGKAESAHRRPRLRPSFGQQKGIGRPMPYKWVMAGLSPIRLPRIFVSSKTQQGVL